MVVLVLNHYLKLNYYLFYKPWCFNNNKKGLILYFVLGPHQTLFRAYSFCTKGSLLAESVGQYGYQRIEQRSAEYKAKNVLISILCLQPIKCNFLQGRLYTYPCIYMHFYSNRDNLLVIIAFLIVVAFV